MQTVEQGVGNVTAKGSNTLIALKDLRSERQKGKLTLLHHGVKTTEPFGGNMEERHPHTWGLAGQGNRSERKWHLS